MQLGAECAGDKATGESVDVKWSHQRLRGGGGWALRRCPGTAQWPKKPFDSVGI
jgi:hypothetical protein